MTIKTLAARGVAKRAIARQLSLAESTVRYHVNRMAEGARDGRAGQQRLAAGFAEAIGVWMEAASPSGARNLAALHEWLVAEHDYPGSLRSVQRFVADVYPPPTRRARRRVETPPGAQAQVDWAVFPKVVLGGEVVRLSALQMVLSHSRMSAVVWSRREDQLSWLACHNRCLERLCGVPAVLRVDNAKTAVVRGAGPWGRINPAYRRYAQAVRFHIDPCLPYAAEHKGKVERQVRTLRGIADPSTRAWRDLEELQAWSDERVAASARRRRCPATGETVWASWQAERHHLQPLPLLPEPFDQVGTRTVGADCMVSFEARQYSVPFAWVGQRVELRGAAEVVQILAGGQVIASHPRHTATRVVIDPAHYEGPGGPRIEAPLPLGRLGRRLEELASLPVAQRPVDLYAALAEVAR